MAASKTVTTKNLIALGAECLADILFALAEEDRDIKRRLRLEIAEQDGGDELAAEIGKRLTSIKNASSIIDWQKRKAFEKDLDLQRQMITERVAKTRPDLALELMWRFMALAEPVINRVDDSNGVVGEIFRQAGHELGEIAIKAKPEPLLLAEQTFDAVTNNHYGEYDRLIPAIMPALAKEGIDHLKAKLHDTIDRRPRRNGEYDHRAAAIVRTLQEIADGEDDVDAFIALTPLKARQTPRVAAGIARRLLTAGRAQEAMIALQKGTPNEGAVATHDLWIDGYHSYFGHSEWEDVYIDVLDATGEPEKAQQIRWDSFEKHLLRDRLRDYLKRLTDFDDVIAEERALTHALTFPNMVSALDFLIEWPAHEQAAKLILRRHTEIDGNAYYLLDPAARALEGAYPLAAVLLRRAMISDTLDRAKSTRYRHAARHLAECQSLHSAIPDYVNLGDHAAFLASLQDKHRRKEGFWGRVREFSTKR
ncbi:DUF6880 family protein [Mesorhizobium sp. M4B.F.Ca.ET.143.01.1.1]|uniref:DUF6880 family protein n=2 Tax=unclassified Mesorhizobium TaxID=325217 RepID=UPI001093D58E|nr:DUF6880 family protein [Mesorhizobium sp. M4B.F.Ca.ET.143.01.1.1]TGV18009.1 hypothetical protein EN786_35630 [Mesorhizobium sp. M4B.F.Ca.ET.143.01.1.1]